MAGRTPRARMAAISWRRCTGVMLAGSVGPRRASSALSVRGEARDDLRLATGAMPSNWTRATGTPPITSSFTYWVHFGISRSRKDESNSILASVHTIVANRGGFGMS